MATKAKKIPFPKEVFVQHAFETGDASNLEENWMRCESTRDDAETDVRIGVYKLDRVIVVEKNVTFTEKPSK